MKTSMKKSIMALSMAVALVFAMPITSLASSSAQASTVTTKVPNTVSVSSPASYAQKAQGAFNGCTVSGAVEQSIVTEAANTLKDSGYIPAGKAANLLMVVELTGTPGTTVSYADASIQATDSIVVLHKGASGWEKIDCTVANGYVTFTAPTFSPYAIAKITNPSAKTGQASNIAAIITLIGLCGLALSTKKYLG